LEQLFFEDDHYDLPFPNSPEGLNIKVKIIITKAAASLSMGEIRKAVSSSANETIAAAI